MQTKPKLNLMGWVGGLQRNWDEVVCLKPKPFFWFDLGPYYAHDYD